MLQLQYIKDHTDEIIARLKIKNVADVEARINEIIALDAERSPKRTPIGRSLLGYCCFFANF